MLYRDATSLGFSARSGSSESIKELRERRATFREIGVKTLGQANWGYAHTATLQESLNLLDKTYKELSINHMQDIEEAMYSSTIEGAVITVPESIAVIEGGFVPRSKSERMVKNTFGAIKYIQQLPKGITEDNLLKVWRQVVEGVCDNESIRGEKYRVGNISVGSLTSIVYTAPEPTAVQGMMDELLRFINKNTGLHPFVKAAIVHFVFVYIHPFCDGNGRVARLLTSKVLIDEGYDKFKNLSVTSAIYEELPNYYNSIELCERYEPDLTYYVAYFLSVLEKLFLKAERGFKPGRDADLTNAELKIVQYLRKLSPREMTQDKCSQALQISKRDASKVLNNLVDRGYLHKARRDRVYYKYYEYPFK